MIPKYDLSDFIFMVTALVFYQHASKRPHESLLREKKKQKKTKAIQLKKENKTKINGLNCFARAANKFRSEFMDKIYGNACVWMQHQRILFVMITNSD